MGTHSGREKRDSGPEGTPRDAADGGTTFADFGDGDFEIFFVQGAAGGGRGGGSGEKHVFGVVDKEAVEPFWGGVHADGGVDDVRVGAGVD